MRTEYIETSDDDQVLEEADPEQEYDDEIAAFQGYQQEAEEEEDTARLEQYLDPITPDDDLQQIEESLREEENQNQ